MTPISDWVPPIIKDAFLGTESDRKYEKNITIIGTRGASKTTMLGCIGLTCAIKNEEDDNFTYDIIEHTVGMRQIISDLCEGKFPPATPPGHIYEADIVLTWKGGWKGNKTVHLPLIETSGEDMETIIGPYRSHMYEQVPNYQQAENLNRVIIQSNAFIVVVPVSRSTMPLPQVVDQEPESLLRNPDVNVVRMLDSITNLREQARAKRPEALGICLTKYDMVNAWFEQLGMNLNDPEGQYRFLHTYFRQTMGKLKNYGLNKVRFFPMFVQVAKETTPEGKVKFVERADGDGLQILTDQRHNIPVYSKESCHALINWVKDIGD